VACQVPLKAGRVFGRIVVAGASAAGDRGFFDVVLRGNKPNKTLFGRWWSGLDGVVYLWLSGAGLWERGPRAGRRGAKWLIYS